MVVSCATSSAILACRASSSGFCRISTTRRVTARVSSSPKPRVVIAGARTQLYVIILGGQAYPQRMFTGKDVTSRAFDGVVAAYTPSLPEIALGVGGVALALALTVVALRVLPFLPLNFADADVQPTAG